MPFSFANYQNNSPNANVANDSTNTGMALGLPRMAKNDKWNTGIPILIIVVNMNSSLTCFQYSWVSANIMVNKLEHPLLMRYNLINPYPSHLIEH